MNNLRTKISLTRTYFYLKKFLKKILPVSIRKKIRVLIKKPSKINLFQQLVDAVLDPKNKENKKRVYTAMLKVIKDTSSGFNGLSSDYIDCFLKIIGKKIRGEYIKDRDLFIKKTDSLDFKGLSHNGWLELYALLFKLGLFREAYAAREKAVRRIYYAANDEVADIKVLVLAVKAAIDQGDFKSAEMFLKRIKEKKIESRELNNLRAYYYLNAGKILAARKIWQRDSNEDGRFMQYIKGKSVAIVGPAASKVEYGNEIDSFNVVIRPTYRGCQSTTETNQYGKNAHISYYNGKNSGDMIDKKDFSFLNDLEFCVFKLSEINKYEFQNNSVNSCKVRLARKNEYFFNGHPNMVPLIIYDILYFEPSKIKVFYSNFFLAKKLHKNNYKNKAVTLQGMYLSLSSHDCLSQVNFVRNIWRAGLIEADRECEKVLNLSAKQYMYELEDIMLSEI